MEQLVEMHHLYRCFLSRAGFFLLARDNWNCVYKLDTTAAIELLYTSVLSNIVGSYHFSFRQ